MPSRVLADKCTLNHLNFCTAKKVPPRSEILGGNTKITFLKVALEASRKCPHRLFSMDMKKNMSLTLTDFAFLNDDKT